MINTEGELIAGYWEDSKYIQFGAIRFSNSDQEYDLALVGDGRRMSLLEKSVNDFLSHGSWRPMVPGVRVAQADGAEWHVGDVIITENADGALRYYAADGKGFGESPFEYRPRLVREDNCHGKAFDAELLDLAYDPATKLTWAVYGPKGDPPDCVGLIWAAVFRVDPGIKYPYQLAKPR